MWFCASHPINIIWLVSTRDLVLMAYAQIIKAHADVSSKAMCQPSSTSILCVCEQTRPTLRCLLMQLVFLSAGPQRALKISNMYFHFSKSQFGGKHGCIPTYILIFWYSPLARQTSSYISTNR